MVLVCGRTMIVSSVGMVKRFWEPLSEIIKSKKLFEAMKSDKYYKTVLEDELIWWKSEIVTVSNYQHLETLLSLAIMSIGGSERPAGWVLNGFCCTTLKLLDPCPQWRGKCLE